MRHDQLELVSELVSPRRVVVAQRPELVRARRVAHAGLTFDDRPRLIDRARFGARIGRDPALVLGVEHSRQDRQRGVEVRIQVGATATNCEILGVHEDVATNLDVGAPSSLMIDVVGAGAAPAEDSRVQSGSLHQVVGLGRRNEPLERACPARIESLHVL